MPFYLESQVLVGFLAFLLDFWVKLSLVLYDYVIEIWPFKYSHMFPPEIRLFSSPSLQQCGNSVLTNIWLETKHKALTHVFVPLFCVDALNRLAAELSAPTSASCRHAAIAPSRFFPTHILLRART